MMNYQQLAGEHLQAFAWRVHNQLLEATKEEDIPEQVLFNRVFVGLHPCVAKFLPSPPPKTLDELFVFGDKVGELIPANDPDWKAAVGEQSASPIVQIEVENEYFSLGPPQPEGML